MARTLFPDIVVNGETVPFTAVAAEAQNHAAPRGKPGIAWRRAASAIAIRTLLLQEARRRKIVAEPRQLGPGRYETEDEARIRALLERAVRIAPPSEDAIHQEWSRDPSRFRAPPLWEVSHILCACDPGNRDALVQAHSRAKALLARALDDPRRFAELAERESDCGSKSAGGMLGQIGPGDTVPEFEAALRGMDEGEITSEPVLTRHGYHIIRLDAFAEGSVLPYPVARRRISDAMEKAAWARAARDFVDALAASAEISGADLRPV